MSDAVARVWRQHRMWSITANRLRQRIDRARRGVLLLAILTAILSLGGSQLEADPVTSQLGRGLLFLAAVSAGVGGLLTRRADTDDIRRWTLARSISEALKGEVIQRLAGGKAYLGGDADGVLTERCHQILEEVTSEEKRLEEECLGVQADGKCPPLVKDVESYITVRLNEQIEGFYRPRAARYRRSRRRLQLLGEILAVLAVVLAAAGSVLKWGSVAAWVPVVTTVSTALVAHLAASRYEQIIVDYLRTARQLERFRDTRKMRSMSDADFIDACEMIMATEHRAWQTGWSEAAQPC